MGYAGIASSKETIKEAIADFGFCLTAYNTAIKNSGTTGYTIVEIDDFDFTNVDYIIITLEGSVSAGTGHAQLFYDATSLTDLTFTSAIGVGYEEERARVDCTGVTGKHTLSLKMYNSGANDTYVKNLTIMGLN